MSEVVRTSAVPVGPGVWSSQWVLCGVVVTEDEASHWRSSVGAEVMQTTTEGGREGGREDEGVSWVYTYDCTD